MKRISSLRIVKVSLTLEVIMFEFFILSIAKMSCLCFDYFFIVNKVSDTKCNFFCDNLYQKQKKSIFMPEKLTGNEIFTFNIIYSSPIESKHNLIKD